MRIPLSHRLIPIVAAGLILAVAETSLQAAIVGPDHLPAQLTGVWRVSLCVTHRHSWIVFQHAETGELHTLGRYVKGLGGRTDWCTCRRLWPGAPACGVTWDIDVKYHNGLQRRGRILRSCHVRNPCIFRGENNGYGHGGVCMNCATYARDAWHYYSGEWYSLPPIATPCALERQVCGW